MHEKNPQLYLVTVYHILHHPIVSCRVVTLVSGCVGPVQTKEKHTVNTISLSSFYLYLYTTLYNTEVMVVSLLIKIHPSSSSLF